MTSRSQLWLSTWKHGPLFFQLQVAAPDVWKEGASNTIESGGRKIKVRYLKKLEGVGSGEDVAGPLHLRSYSR
jgi:hypothetical protein